VALTVGMFGLGLALAVPGGASADTVLTAGFEEEFFSDAGPSVPPGLTAEVLTAEVPPNPLGTLDVEANCDPAGVSTVTYAITGIAIGPYPGTFVETLTFTVGPQNQAGGPINLVGPLLSFQANFTIFSSTTTIVGSKSGVRSDPGLVGVCREFQSSEHPELGIPTQRGRLTVFTVDTRYQATIAGPLGTTSDAGRSIPHGAATEAIDDQTSGHATGGGKAAPDVTFGFNARSDGTLRSGNCNVVDRAANVHIQCVDVRSYAQTATHATFSGRATVDGTETTYRIDVDDNGEPGTGRDTFKIVTGTGYVAAGVLTQGNVQVHS
jgi:hypothetical protein